MNVARRSLVSTAALVLWISISTAIAQPSARGYVDVVYVPQVN